MLVESGMLDFGSIQNPLMIGIRNLLSTDMIRSPESSTWNPETMAWNPRKSWIPLHGATRKEFNSHKICLEHQHSRRSIIGFRKTNMATVSLFWKTNMATASSVWNINMAAISWVWKTNMAAISLFWNTNMAAMISCKNTLLDMLTFTPYILQTTWYAEKSTVGLVHTFIYHQTNRCQALSRESLSVLLPSGQTVNNLIQMILMAKNIPVVRK